jgi:hypothetical protein
MPYQGRIVRPLFRHIRYRYRSIVQVIVDQAVVKSVPDLWTDSESKIRRHGDIALIEETMDIAAHQDAILHLVRLELGEGTYVGRIECWQRFLTGDRAATPVRLCDHHPERTLPQPRKVYRRLPVAARDGLQRTHGDRRWCRGDQLRPYPRTFPFRQVVVLAAHCVCIPIQRRTKVGGLVE